MIKYYVAGVLQRVLDRAIQVHGALGLTDETPLAVWYRHERAARIYDGPDEVHKVVVARRTLKKYGHRGEVRMTGPIDQPTPVRADASFDVAALATWLREREKGLEGEPELLQFGRGFSNLTYLVRFGSREPRHPPCRRPG